MMTKITFDYFEFYLIPDLCSKREVEILFSLPTHDPESILVLLDQLHSDHLNTFFEEMHFKL